MRQRLWRDNGRDSIIRTRSPSRHSPRSSCAMKRLRRLIRLAYNGCWTRRSTCTTTVLVILAATTVPSRRLTRSRTGSPRPLSRDQRENPRQFAPRLAVTGGVVKLVGPQLEPQTENFLSRFALLDAQISDAHLLKFVKLQRPRPP